MIAFLAPTLSVLLLSFSASSVRSIPGSRVDRVALRTFASMIAPKCIALGSRAVGGESN